MTTPPTKIASESDSNLWQLVCQGSTSAFEVLVRRYQSLVCSVAYSACGNLALSEDVAQETFWSAWRQRAALEHPEHLPAWLCGIARNQARNARRRASRPDRSAETSDVLTELSTDNPGPADEAVSREEESLIWQALGEIPEAYREPLILFYREDQSVAETARALDLSEDAVKQRLTRGRRMLREQVAELVERGLRRSRPGPQFTVTLMAGLATYNVSAKTALAGAGAAKAAAGILGASGALGGLLGSASGLLGQWVGIWVPAQAAPTRHQRNAILRSGRRMMLVSVAFLTALVGLATVLAGTPNYLFAWVGWMVAFGAYQAVECVYLARQIQRMRAEPSPDDSPNDSALRAGWTAMASRIGDRVYRSEATLLGLPLIDVNLSAPAPPDAGKSSGASVPQAEPRVARGWVAVGDDARGILLAIGSKARALVALGGRALGVVSFGGVALGLVAFGGIGLGVVGVGGLGVGVYALGGGAVGWRSAGGLAAGWDLACGGGAVARHSAIGGGAVARDHALGGAARARHANDAAARRALLSHPFVRFAFMVMGQQHVLKQLSARAEAPDPKTTAAAGRFSLDNGLRARIRPIQGASDVALVVLYDLGGDHDPAGRSGLGHLVEHVYITAAAGTQPARTADAFFQRYRAGGNAQTGDRYTVFATVFPRADLEQELKEAAARMGDLRITANDLDREKPRLLDELGNMFGRLPALGALNIARELIRPTPREGRKGGVPEHVNAITLDDVRAHWARYYKPRNAILVLAGAVDEPAARAAVRTHFAGLAPGEEIPQPGEAGPPKIGARREVTAQSLDPQARPVSCLAYAAPAPGSDLYAPFLVLIARFMIASAPANRGGANGGPSLYFPLLDDPAVVGVSGTANQGETAAQTTARLESFVADTVTRPLRDDERAAAREIFAFFLGTAEIPDWALARNTYGAAFSLARREQLGIDDLKLRRALEALTDPDLRHAADKIFAPARHASACVRTAK